MTILASDAIKDSYNKEGYIIIDNVLSENEVEYLRTVIESEDVKQSLKNIGISSIYESVHITDITLLHPAIKKTSIPPKNRHNSSIAYRGEHTASPFNVRK